jgi:hypothetical protein
MGDTVQGPVKILSGPWSLPLGNHLAINDVNATAEHTNLHPVKSGSPATVGQAGHDDQLVVTIARPLHEKLNVLTGLEISPTTRDGTFTTVATSSLAKTDARRLSSLIRSAAWAFWADACNLPK